MRTVIFYYRSTDPAIIAAKLQDNTDSLTIETEAKAFAARFGGVPVFSEEAAPRFVGITFVKGHHTPQHPSLWTDPKPNDLRMTPRFKNVPPKLRTAAQKLATEWNTHYPKHLAEPRHGGKLLPALGVNEMLLMGNHLSYFFHNDVSWISASVPLEGERFEEVLGSVFAAARNEWQISQVREAPQPVVVVDGLAPEPKVESVAANENEDRGLADDPALEDPEEAA